MCKVFQPTKQNLKKYFYGYLPRNSIDHWRRHVIRRGHAEKMVLIKRLHQGFLKISPLSSPYHYRAIFPTDLPSLYHFLTILTSHTSFHMNEWTFASEAKVGCFMSRSSVNIIDILHNQTSSVHHWNQSSVKSGA